MANVPRLPKFYWSGTYLSKLKEEMGDECIFLCLSPVSFRMLTDMTAMLLWPTRYKEKEVPDVGRIAHQELNVPCLLDLYSRLDELNNTDWLQAQFDALGSRMTELEEMDINVTQTVGGGCSCGCSGETTSVTQTTSGLFIDPEETATIPPYITESVIVSDPVKCRSANYLAESVTNATRALGQIGDAGGGVVAIAGVVLFALTLISPVLGDEIIAAAVITRWVYGIVVLGESVDFVFEYFSDLANMMQGRAEELTCLLYNYDTASEMGASLSGYIENMVDELRVQAGMSDASASMMSSVLVNIFGPNVVNWFVENVGTAVPADFVPQYDCLCGAAGDTCPTAGIVLAGVGTLPAGDLTGTTQGFASSYNSSTGYFEVIFELPDNYCVTIDNATYTPTESHETCSNGVMVASDGSCIRRFVARSLEPFATAIIFDSVTTDCTCFTAIGCRDEGVPAFGQDDTLEFTEMLFHIEDFGLVTDLTLSRISVEILGYLDQDTRMDDARFGVSLWDNTNSIWEDVELARMGDYSTGTFYADFTPHMTGGNFNGDIRIWAQNGAQDNNLLAKWVVGKICVSQ